MPTIFNKGLGESILSAGNRPVDPVAVQKAIEASTALPKAPAVAEVAVTAEPVAALSGATVTQLVLTELLKNLGDAPTITQLEKEYLTQVLKATNGNKTLTAKVLGVTIKTVYNKMDQHGLRPAAQTLA